MNYKAIIFDLDGTAMPPVPKGMPTLRLIQAVQSKKDIIHLSCATGRGWTFCKEILNVLQLQDLCIISAGTQIIDPKTGNVVWQVFIHPSDVKAVVEKLKPFLYEVLVNDEYPGDGKVAQQRNHDFPINYINVQAVSMEDAEEICREMKPIHGITCTKVHSQTHNHIDLHITDHHATKEQAVHRLCHLLKISPKETIGIGDGLNDVHLFSAVGYKVAMGNAVPELKKLADRVIGSLQEEGLAVFIEEISVR